VIAEHTNREKADALAEEVIKTVKAVAGI